MVSYFFLWPDLDIVEPTFFYCSTKKSQNRNDCLDPQYADAFINLGNLLKGDGILKGSEDVLQGVDRGRPE